MKSVSVGAGAGFVFLDFMFECTSTINALEGLFPCRFVVYKREWFKRIKIKSGLSSST